MRQPNTFNHCLTADHMARLRALSDHWGVSRSEMIRRLIDDAFCQLYPVRMLQPPPGAPMPGEAP